MVNLGIPPSLRRAAEAAVADVEEELVQLTRRELQLRIDAARSEAFEEGVARGRELELEEAKDDVLAARQQLGEEIERAQELLETLATSIEEIAAEAGRVQKRIEEAVDIVAAKMALKLLFELESSESMLSSVVAKIIEDFRPKSIRISVDAKLAERLSERFSDDQRIEFAPRAEGQHLSVHFDTDGGSFEYCTANAFEQLKRLIEKRNGAHA